MALIQVVLTRRGSIATTAILALGYLPISNAGVSVLKSTVASGEDIPVTAAAASLNKWGIHDWTVSARSRMLRMKDPLGRAVLAARLAEAGDYSRWPTFLSIIGDEKTIDGIFFTLIGWLRMFDQMPGNYGPRLQLAHDLHQLAPRLSPVRRATIEKEISRVQSSAAYRSR